MTIKEIPTLITLLNETHDVIHDLTSNNCINGSMLSNTRAFILKQLVSAGSSQHLCVLTFGEREICICEQKTERLSNLTIEFRTM